MKLHGPTLLGALLIISACADPSSLSRPEPQNTVGDDVLAGASRLPIQCAGREYFLIGLGDAVRVQRSDGTMLVPPRGMDVYVPVGHGCARANGDDAYLVVQYGESAVGCKVCEWFFVYDAEGQPMHDSVPPFTGEGATLAPNNSRYARLSKQLGLEQPEIQYDDARYN